MKKILLLISFFTIAGNSFLFAQLYNNPLLNAYVPGQKNASNFYLEAGGSYDIASNAITNQLFNNYLFSNFLEKEAKESVLPNLGEMNRLGAHAEQYLFFSWQNKKKENAGYYINLKNRRHYGVAFTDDAYTTLLFGNARFAGKTATFDGSEYSRSLYQALQAGMYAKAGKKLTLGGGIGFARVTRYTDLSIHKGSLFTSSNGDSLALFADAEARYANLKGNDNKAAGIGGFVNVFAVYALDDDKSFLQFAVNDLGFAYINKYSNSFTANKQIIYRGYEIYSYNQNFNSANTELLPEKLGREIDSTQKSERFTALLPAQIQFRYKQYLGKKTAALLGVEYFLAVQHLPSFHANISQDITDKFALQGGVNLLGYGKIGFNFNTRATIANSWFLTAGTNHLEALFSAKNTFGQGAYFSLGKGF